MTNLDPSKRARGNPCLGAVSRKEDAIFDQLWCLNSGRYCRWASVAQCATIDDIASRLAAGETESQAQAALAPMTPLVLDREAVARDSVIDAARNARDVLRSINDRGGLGIGGEEHGNGADVFDAWEQLDAAIRNLTTKQGGPSDSIIALTSQAGGLAEDVARLIEALEPFAEQATIAEVMTGFAPPEWAGATPERRIEMIGDRKRKHDDNIVRARSVLSAIRASNPSVGGGA